MYNIINSLRLLIIYGMVIIMDDTKVKDMVYTALFAALVCVSTFIIKVPLPVTGGYAHIGDGAIFLAVILIGKKNSNLWKRWNRKVHNYQNTASAMTHFHGK